MRWEKDESEETSVTASATAAAFCAATGITAVALLLTAALFAFLQPRLAWLSAFTVGAWIPGAYFLKNGDPRILFVFVIPALGALAGVACRKVFGLMFRPV